MIRNYLNIILNAGILAPSCDNNQPWKIKIISDTEVHLYNNPKDKDLCGWGQRGSFIAHGAFIENVRIAAEHIGWRLKSTIFPEGIESPFIAKLSFTKHNVSGNSLYNELFLRSSNRKKYSKKKLSGQHKHIIVGDDEKLTGVYIKLIDSKFGLKKGGEVGGINEKIMLENKNVHDYFYSHLRWSEAEDIQHPAFNVKTLELPPLAVYLLKKGSRWGTLQKMNKFGFSNIVSKGNAKLYATSGALGVVLIDNVSVQSYIKAGIAIERSWLKATQNNISMQLISGIPLSYLSLKFGNVKTFNDFQKKLLLDSYNILEDIFKIKNQFVALFFRVGYSKPPTTKTRRNKLEEILA